MSQMPVIKEGGMAELDWYSNIAYRNETKLSTRKLSTI